MLTAYRVIVREGRAVDHEALLDGALLLDVWDELRLPARCRSVWERTFPELRR